MENYSTRAEAEKLLAWAGEQNPGRWVAHSQTTGRAAGIIAKACGLDADKAYVLGLLHDIGRFEGVRDLHHIIAGHTLMAEQGFLHNAQICLTHSFPLKDIRAYCGKFDCSETEVMQIEAALHAATYDDYDKLIQLCDGICLPQGVCLLDVRLIDVTRRYGFNGFTLKKWDVAFALKSHFDELCAGNIYDLFYDEIHDVSFR